METPVKSLAGKRIFVGLSGGVDSAVTAALLKHAGAEVTGVFIKGWYPPGLPCTWAEDRRDAMRVAARLQIPFCTLDASVEYKKGVIDYLIREYRAGRTPNPDVMCNRDVKFGAFYDYSRKEDADFIATGHYAKIGTREEHAAAERIVPEKPDAAGKLSVEQHVPCIARGIDESKDQSYFLWAIPSAVLPYTLFPLGGMEKSEVRRLATAYRLPVAEKRDSQGICFLGPVSIEEFLQSEIGLVPGKALDEKGIEVGMHHGAIAYTLGERIALTGAIPGPWYVTHKDIEANTLTVAHALKQVETSAPQAIPLHDTNWHTGVIPVGIVSAQYRYHGSVIQGTLSARGLSFMPTEAIAEPVASGQSLVFYDADELIGGGIIGE